MENNVIGDKNVFAVEFNIANRQGASVWGECGLWLAGYQLHEEGNIICVDAFLSGLQGVVAAKTDPDIVFPHFSSAKELLFNMTKVEDGIWRYRFFYTEGFDDFLSFFKKNSEYTAFLWAIHPDMADLDVYREYPKDVQEVVVKNTVMRLVVEEFAKTLKNLKPA